MNIHHLLDRSADLQIRIIRHLYRSGGVGTKEDLMREFQVSLPTLHKYLDEINASLEAQDGKLRIIFDGPELFLRLAPEFTIHEMMIDRLKDSIKYQLLVEHMDGLKKEITYFTQKFQISRASFFRKIKELNDALAEFKLTLENGEVQGDELQVRYFYFQLLWYTESRVTSDIELSMRQMVIDHLEATFQKQFPEEIRQKIALYLEIFGRRRKKQDQFQIQITKEEEKTISPKVLKLVKEALSIYSERYAITIETFELKSFYFFLCNINIFSATDDVSYYIYERNFQEQTPVIQMNDIIFDYLNENEFFNQKRNPGLWLEITMFLFRIHFNVFKYSGWFEEYYEHAATAGEGIPEMDFYQPHAEEMVHRVQKFAKKYRKALIPECVLFGVYMDILLLISRRNVREIVIGLSFSFNRVSNRANKLLLIEALTSNYPVEFEDYVPGKYYDLVISDHKIEKDELVENYYVISEIGNEYDIFALKEMLNELANETGDYKL
ncbi:helix-turn-helix domain-containing protein [Enterococcus sp. 669A]|uniref:Helix-turn-helix domain-containing protein n=1 Tax=Candidatus Enterococcus moelleringii TaxID=2815325 RepID=A0ABS3LFR2_9ENTE|nr:helix-turn-helix domain-containing protein [Enterococcus sp. 669A]MBO1308484.1 helix-turn-helix domain-containing protein [Enterococcus sp. 669A]